MLGGGIERECGVCGEVQGSIMKLLVTLCVCSWDLSLLAVQVIMALNYLKTDMKIIHRGLCVCVCVFVRNLLYIHPLSLSLQMSNPPMY